MFYLKSTVSWVNSLLKSTNSYFLVHYFLLSPCSCPPLSLKCSHTHTHTHTHIYIYCWSSERVKIFVMRDFIFWFFSSMSNFVIRKHFTLDNFYCKQLKYNQNLFNLIWEFIGSHNSEVHLHSVASEMARFKVTNDGLDPCFYLLAYFSW